MTMSPSASVLLVVATLGVLFTAEASAQDTANSLDAYNESVDRAVDRGLAYLASQQVGESKPAWTKTSTQAFEGSFTNGPLGINSLVLMAFLSKGHIPGRGPYGELLNRGIDNLLAHQREDGMFIWAASHGPMYSHCITTLLLTEVSGMVDSARQQKINQALSRALPLILEANQVGKPPEHSGGWRYQPNSKDSDLSMTGWALMSLRAARLNGAQMPKKNIDDAVQYILNCRNSKNGGFGYYVGASPNYGLSGQAILCLLLAGHQGHESLIPAGDFVLQNLPEKFEPEVGYSLYQIYYASQGMYQLGGKYWDTFAPWMYDNLLSQQNEDGSWLGPKDTGPCYATAMAILAMTPPLNQLPIYQRIGDDLGKTVHTQNSVTKE